MDNDKKSNGAFVGAVIVIILIIVGAIYMWNKKPAEVETPVENNEVSEDATVLNAYEELGGIESDVNTINPDTDLKIDSSVQ